MQEIECDAQRETVTGTVSRLEHTPPLESTSTDESLLAPTLDRAWLCTSYEQLDRPSAWRSIRARQNRDPSSGRSPFALLGHLLATAVIYQALFAAAWALGLCYAWLNSIHPLPREILKLASRVELAVFYVDTALCAFFSLVAASRFCREIMR